MDDVIYEEFKGTGNMEIHLDRKMAEKRIYPAINVNRSAPGEELLLKPDVLQKMWVLRKLLYPMDDLEAMEFLLDKVKATKGNNEFFDAMRRGNRLSASATGVAMSVAATPLAFVDLETTRRHGHRRSYHGDRHRRRGCRRPRRGMATAGQPRHAHPALHPAAHRNLRRPGGPMPLRRRGRGGAAKTGRPPFRRP